MSSLKQLIRELWEVQQMFLENPSEEILERLNKVETEYKEARKKERQGKESEKYWSILQSIPTNIICEFLNEECNIITASRCIGCGNLDEIENTTTDCGGDKGVHLCRECFT